MSDKISKGNLDIEPSVLQGFAQSVQLWKDKMSSYGFSPEALNSFSFSLTHHSAQSRGKRFPFDNQKPHYEMTIEIPSTRDISIGEKDLPFSDRSVKNQVRALFALMHYSNPSGVLQQAGKILTALLRNELKEELEQNGYRVVAGANVSLIRATVMLQCNPSLLMDTVTQLTEDRVSVDPGAVKAEKAIGSANRTSDGVYRASHRRPHGLTM